jgi:2-polyprenyl-6-methoxyphenol hydroxylase-like FAD-dependent oxidoreductase
VKLLDVRLDRLRRWYADGLLLIGDAAHAMSPVGGVGINLAVQDAVAAARILAPALRAGGSVPVAVLRRVQLRRWWPTALIQAGQRLAHRRILRPCWRAGERGSTRRRRGRRVTGERARHRASHRSERPDRHEAPERRCRSRCGWCAGSRCCRASRGG